MPDNRFERLRLLLMQDVLPVGMAIVDRVKRGGFSKITDVFVNEEDPLDELRNEGDQAASLIREKLDEITPGLGNPVVNVKISVEDASIQKESLDDSVELKVTLERIEERIELLDKYLDSI